MTIDEAISELESIQIVLDYRNLERSQAIDMAIDALNKEAEVNSQKEKNVIP